MMQRNRMQGDRKRDAATVSRYLGSFKPDPEPELGKSMQESTLLREQGNAAFSRRDLNEALLKYTRSIATAPCDRNTIGLALAFANRSAVHFSLGNYEDCLSDIEQALKINYPSWLRYEVLKRRAECHRDMGNMEAAGKNFEDAISCCLEEDKKRSMEQELAALKPPEQVYKPRLRVRPPPEKYLGDNPMIPGASACIEIKHNEKYGRHLVATQDIPPGVVLIVEEPFGSVLHPDKCDDYCFRCMRRCSAMIPCKSCAIAMYCSETCSELSWMESHDLECAILAKLIAADMPKQSMIVLQLFIVALKKHGNLQQLYDYATQLDTEGSNVCDAEGCFDPTDLRAVYNLEPCKLTDEDSDAYAQCCAFLVDCIVEHSHLLNERDNELKRFTGGLLMKFMRIVTINAFQVQDWATEESDDFGSAIYSICSLINHQCIANAVQYQHGNTIVMFTILPIDKGEQVFISYHGERRDPGRTRSELLEVESRYGFACGCRGCNNPLPGTTCLPLCPKCRTAVDITPEQDVVECRQCYQVFNAQDVSSAAVLLLKTVQQMFTRPLKLANVPEICKIITTLHRTVELSNMLRFGVQGLLQRAITRAGLD